MKKFMNELNQEHDGAIAFEYIIILVIMAVCIFTAWGFLVDALEAKAQDIANFIANNGQSSLGTNGGVVQPNPGP